jgi:hypothetical protein
MSEDFFLTDGLLHASVGLLQHRSGCASSRFHCAGQPIHGRDSTGRRESSLK